MRAFAAGTECHLIRSFHLEFGLPPHAYHLWLRLAVAAELLSNGLSVSTVAYECGFADQSHLLEPQVQGGLRADAGGVGGWGNRQNLP